MNASVPVRLAEPSPVPPVLPVLVVVLLVVVVLEVLVEVVPVLPLLLLVELVELLLLELLELLLEELELLLLELLELLLLVEPVAVVVLVLLPELELLTEPVLPDDELVELVVEVPVVVPPTPLGKKHWPTSALQRSAPGQSWQVAPRTPQWASAGSWQRPAASQQPAQVSGPQGAAPPQPASATNIPIAIKPRISTPRVPLNAPARAKVKALRIAARARDQYGALCTHPSSALGRLGSASHIGGQGAIL